MFQRTFPHRLNTWDDAIDLTEIVTNQRPKKRTNAAKSRRRTRRHENSLLNSQLRHSLEAAADWL